MAAKANIVVDQGSTFTTYLSLSDTDGNILDLTGYTAYGQIRKWYTSTSYVTLNLSIENPTQGNISLVLDANTTAAMSPGKYVYDIDTIDSFGTITRVIEGILTVTPTVTQLANTTYSMGL